MATLGNVLNDTENSNGLMSGMGLTRLGAITGIDATSAGQTTLYTVPTGKSAICTLAVISTTAYTAPSTGDNELVDPGLEAWTDNTLDSYDEYAVGTGTLAKELVIVHGDSAAAKITCTAVNDGFRIGQGVTGKTPGIRYEGKIWARKGDASGVMIQAQIAALNGDWTNATQIFNFTSGAWEAWTSPTEPDINQKAVLILDTSWAEMTTDNAMNVPTIPANGTLYFYYGITSSGEGDIGYLDDATLRVSGSVTVLAYSIGSNSLAYDNFASSTSTTLTANEEFEIKTNGAVTPVYSADTAIKLNIDTATNAVMVLSVDLFGYLF